VLPQSIFVLSVHVHCAPPHVVPAGHTTPQSPQFALLARMSVHVPVPAHHFWFVAPQIQDPFEQVSPT
jgi:hypothetical protein